MTEWTNQTAPPSHGPLFQAALGGTPALFSGGTVASVTGPRRFEFTAPHGLNPGQGVTFGGGDPVCGGDAECDHCVYQCSVH